MAKVPHIFAGKKKWYEGHPLEAQHRKEEEEVEKARATDVKAQAEGKLVGRIIEIPVADGGAVYIVREVDKSQVNIEHMKWGDGYSDWHLRGGGWWPKREIAKIIKEHDDFEAIFSKGV